MLSRNFILSFAVLCFKASYSLPSVKFPIDAQLPPVAVAGQPFSFTFSPATFTSAFDISYSANDLPAWLQFEAASRTLVGIPARSDVGNAKLELQAKDSEGNLVVHIDLVVLAKSSIKADQNLFAKRLSTRVGHSTPDTLLLSPETSFDLEIRPDVFESDGDGIEFYATSENHAPLPAWVRFDREAVKFSGTTPSLLTPQSSPQTFNFSLVASHVPHFSESAIDFQISVTNHILAFLEPVQSFNVSADSIITIPPLIEQLRLDANSVSRDQIATISSNQPGWLMLRSSDLSFYGQAPEEINSTTFRLEVDDSSRNVASVEIQLLLSPADAKPQEVYLGVQSITVGQQFDYMFADAVDRTNDVEIDLGLATSWLHFERTNASVYGVVPSTIQGDALNISATVKRDGQITKLEYLTLKVSNIPNNATNGTLSNGTTVSGPAPTQTETSTADLQKKSSKHALVLIIALPIILFLLLSLVVGILIKRLRRKRTRHYPVFATIEASSRSPGSEATEAFTEYSSGTEIANNYHPPSPIPQVSIHWAQSRLPTRRPGTTDNTGTTFTPRAHSSWDEMLLEVETLRSQALDGTPRNDKPNSAATVHAHVDRSPSPTTSPPPLVSAKNMFRTPHKANSRSVLRFDGGRTGGLGHGDSMASPNLNNQRATLRSVPLSPLDNSPSVKDRMLGTGSAIKSPAFSNWLRPENNGEGAANGDGGSSQRRPSFSSDDSESEILEQASYFQARKHSRRRTASTPVSGSLWEDEEWMTEGSTSRSGNWHTQGPLYSGNQIPTEASLENSVLRQWDGRPPLSFNPAMSEATSMRSHRWEESQTNSLRFI